MADLITLSRQSIDTLTSVADLRRRVMSVEGTLAHSLRGEDQSGARLVRIARTTSTPSCPYPPEPANTYWIELGEPKFCAVPGLRPLEFVPYEPADLRIGHDSRDRYLTPGTIVFVELHHGAWHILETYSEPGPATTTTEASTPLACQGKCRMVWDGSEWHPDLSYGIGCSQPTTTTTSGEEPTSTTAEDCGTCPTTSTTAAGPTTTTTAAECECQIPDWCGTEVGECAYTWCVSGAANNQPVCGPTTSTTAADECDCATTTTLDAETAVCKWRSHVGAIGSPPFSSEQTSGGVSDVGFTYFPLVGCRHLPVIDWFLVSKGLGCGECKHPGIYYGDWPTQCLEEREYPCEPIDPASNNCGGSAADPEDNGCGKDCGGGLVGWIWFEYWGNDPSRGLPGTVSDSNFQWWELENGNFGAWFNLYTGAYEATGNCCHCLGPFCEGCQNDNLQLNWSACFAPQPSLPGSACGDIEYTQCQPRDLPPPTTTTPSEDCKCWKCYTTTTTSDQPTTTTTADPCKGAKCRVRWNVGESDWDEEYSECQPECPCSHPSGMGEDDCDVRVRPCVPPPPTTTTTEAMGACCTGSLTPGGPGSCELTIESDCNPVNSVWLGPDTDCEDCQSGACCESELCYIAASQAICEGAQNPGMWMGVGTECDELGNCPTTTTTASPTTTTTAAPTTNTTQCPSPALGKCSWWRDPSGVNTLVDTNCEGTDVCTEPPGDPPEEAQCAETDCQPATTTTAGPATTTTAGSTGACCGAMAIPGCTQVSEMDCTMGGGTWVGGACGEESCPATTTTAGSTGACCGYGAIPGCSQRTEMDCTMGGGTFNGGSCDPDPCEP